MRLEQPSSVSAYIHSACGYLLKVFPRADYLDLCRIFDRPSLTLSFFPGTIFELFSVTLFKSDFVGFLPETDKVGRRPDLSRSIAILAAGLFFVFARAGSTSIPKSSDRSPASASSARSLFFAARLSIFSLSRWTIFPTKSSTFIPRNTKKSSGFSSRRTDTPYRAAATCLHISAQSGHEHSSLISCGVGNNPVPCLKNASLRSAGNSPESSDCIESSYVRLAAMSAFSIFSSSGLMAILME